MICSISIRNYFFIGSIVFRFSLPLSHRRKIMKESALDPHALIVTSQSNMLQKLRRSEVSKEIIPFSNNYLPNSGGVP